jgi:hypothetical protein
MAARLSQGPGTRQSAADCHFDGRNGSRILSISPAAIDGGVDDSMADNVLTSPRFVDQQAFEDFAGTLRSLIDHASNASGRLEAVLKQVEQHESRTNAGAAQLHEGLRLGARILKAFQTRIDQAERVMQTLARADQSAAQRAEMFETVVAGAVKRAEMSSDAAVTKRLAVLDEQLDAKAAGAGEIEQRVASALDRFKGGVEEIIARAITQVEAAVVERQSTHATIEQALADAMARSQSVCTMIDQSERDIQARLAAIDESVNEVESVANGLRTAVLHCDQARRSLEDSIAQSEARGTGLAQHLDEAMAQSLERMEAAVAASEAKAADAASRAEQSLQAIADRADEAIQAAVAKVEASVRGAAAGAEASIHAAAARARRDMQADAERTATQLSDACARATASSLHLEVAAREARLQLDDGAAACHAAATDATERARRELQADVERVKTQLSDSCARASASSLQLEVAAREARLQLEEGVSACHAAAANATARAESSLDALTARAESTLHGLASRVEMTMQAAMSTSEAAAAELNKRAESVRERLDARLDEAMSLSAGILAELNARGDSAKQSITVKVDEAVAAMRSRVDEATGRGEMAVRALNNRLDEAAHRQREIDLKVENLSRVAARVESAAATCAKLDDLLNQLEPWRGVMLEANADELPAPLARLVEDLREGLAADMGSLSDALRGIAARADSLFSPAPAAPAAVQMAASEVEVEQKPMAPVIVTRVDGPPAVARLVRVV